MAQRNYSGTDTELHTAGQLMINNFTEDLAAFGAMFPTSATTAFKNSMQTDLNTAMAYPLDTGVVSQIEILTEDVKTTLTEAAEALHFLNVFALATWTSPQDSKKQRGFGQETWTAARNSTMRMVDALREAHAAANAAPLKAPLIAHDYTQPMIDNLATIQTNLLAKYTLQQDAIDNRPITTQQRVELNNAFYAKMVLVHTWSLVVFFGNEAKLNQYALGMGTGPTLTSIEFTILDNHGNPVEGVTGSYNGLPEAHTAMSGMDGKMEFHGSWIPETGNVSFVKLGYNTLNIPDQVAIPAQTNEVTISIIALAKLDVVTTNQATGLPLAAVTLNFSSPSLPAPVVTDENGLATIYFPTGTTDVIGEATKIDFNSLILNITLSDPMPVYTIALMPV